MEKLNNMFYEIRTEAFNQIREKNIDIDLLSFELGIDRELFIERFTKMYDDFSFYLKAIEVIDSWEA